jgi:hypothetical protein
MVGKIFAWLLGLALFNFALFTVCFFWAEIGRLIITPTGMILALLLALGLSVPLGMIHYAEYRKKEGYRKLKMRQQVEASQQKEIGIDF